MIFFDNFLPRIPIGDKQIGRLSGKVVHIQPCNVIHRIIVIVDQVHDIDESVADFPVQTTQWRPCQVAAELNGQLIMHDGWLIFSLIFVLILFFLGQFYTFLLQRFYQLHLFKIRVYFVENRPVVFGNPHVEQFLMDR